MVVVGHSQGGLITKLTAADMGDRLWNTVVRVPPDQIQCSEQFRTLLRRVFFVKPVPFFRKLSPKQNPLKLQIIISAHIQQSRLQASIYFMLFVKPISLLPDFRIGAAYTEFTVEVIYIDFSPGKADHINKFA